MGSLVHARPLTLDDEDVLAPLDAAYARRFGLEPLVSRASLSFYVRSGHAFVAVRAGREVGFAFAQAVWNGARPTVYLNRLAVADSDEDPSDANADEGDLDARLALVEAGDQERLRRGGVRPSGASSCGRRAGQKGVGRKKLQSQRLRHIRTRPRLPGREGGVRMARVLLGVRGMDTKEAATKVQTTLCALPGVSSANAGLDGQAAVEYDPGELTIMDLIRALRRIGFLSGMV